MMLLWESRFILLERLQPGRAKAFLMGSRRESRLRTTRRRCVKRVRIGYCLSRVQTLSTMDELDSPRLSAGTNTRPEQAEPARNIVGRLIIGEALAADAGDLGHQGSVQADVDPDNVEERVAEVKKSSTVWQTGNVVGPLVPVKAVGSAVRRIGLALGSATLRARLTGGVMNLTLPFGALDWSGFGQLLGRAFVLGATISGGSAGRPSIE